MNNENMRNERVSEVINAAYGIMSAIRLTMANSIEPVGVIGCLLYLESHDSLSEQVNGDINGSEIIAILDRDYISTIAGNIFNQWVEKGILYKTLCADLHKNEILYSVLTDYAKILKQISPLEIFKFWDVIHSQHLTKKECLYVFDTIIENAINRMGRSGGIFSQPVEVSELASLFLMPGYSTVFNPFSGLMSYATSIKGYASYTGVEINKTIWGLGMLRVSINDEARNVNSVLGDVSTWTQSKYDVIISTPPFNYPIEMSSILVNKRENASSVAIRRFAETTTDKGQLFTVVPMSVLWSDKDKEMRQEIIAQDYLDTIVLLPEKLFACTSIGTALVFLNKRKTDSGFVKMIDARTAYSENGNKRILDVERVLDMCKSKGHSIKEKVVVQIDEFAENDWTWDMMNYLHKEDMVIPDGHCIYMVKDILQPANTERHFQEERGHVAMISDLSNDAFVYEKSSYDFPVSDNLKNTVKLTESAILLSSIRALKPTYCYASESEPLFLQQNVSAFVFDDKKINPGYLCYQLSKAVLSPVGIIPRITKGMLCRLRITLPDLCLSDSLSLQKSCFETEKYAEKLAKARELGLQEIIDKMKAEYINEVRMRKHDMRPYMRQLASTERLMRFYLTNRDSETFEANMLSQLNYYHDALSHLSDLLEHLSDEEKYGISEKFNIDQYLYNLEILHNDDEGYDLMYDCNDSLLEKYGLPFHQVDLSKLKFDNIDSFKELCNQSEDDVVPLYVNISPVDFDRLVKNILENAKKHGFTDCNRNDYIVHVYLSIDENRQMFQIDFSNNGNPLPKGMTKERFGLNGEKAGLTGGTGRGGNIIKNIVTHYGGDYDIFVENNLTTVRVLLPIMQQTYEE